MSTENLRAGFVLVGIVALTGCADAAEPTELETKISGHVLATDDASPLAGVRVTARTVDVDRVAAPEFHPSSDDDSAIGVVLTDGAGRYELVIPRGWVGLAFDHEGSLRAYRTENTRFHRELALDVALAAEPAPVAFAMPQAGDDEVVLDFADQPDGSRARLCIEPGDLVLADQSPILHDVVARVHAPDLQSGGSTWASNAAAGPDGVEPMQPFGVIDVELSSGDERVEVARRATLAWEIQLEPDQLVDAMAAWSDGRLRSYSLDTRTGLWVHDPARLEIIGDTIVVERTHFSAGAVGQAQATAAPCDGGYTDSIIGLDSVLVAGTSTLTAGTSSADVGSNGDIKVTGKTVVRGRASTSAGSVTILGKAKVTGGAFTGVPTFVAPIPDDDFARVRAKNSNANVASSLSDTDAIRLSSSETVHFPAGDYAISSIDLSAASQLTCSGLVRIYLSGDVKVAGQAKFNTGAGCELVLLSDGVSSFYFAGGSAMSAIIYAPHSDIAFSGNGNALTGSMLGRSVSIVGTFDFVGTGDPIDASRVCEPDPLPPSDAGDDGDAGESTGGSGMETLPDLPN